MSIINRCRHDAEILDSLRQRLPEYLVARGVELRKNGTRLIGKCPVHDDRNPSFAVYGDHHKFCGCYPCGFKGDVFDVSRWLGCSSSFPEAIQDVADTLGVNLEKQSDRRRIKATKPPHRAIKSPSLPFVLSVADREKIRMARLTFSDAYDAGQLDAIASEMGFEPKNLRMCDTWQSGLGLWEGKLAYLYPQGMKYRNPTGKKPRFVWECGKALAPWRMDCVKPETRTIYLTEGESDCMALCAVGIEADGTAVCVASPGTSFQRQWASLFRSKRVVICFDLDAAGKDATVKVAKMLKGYAKELIIWKGLTRHD
jgi:hypothetical protein